MKKVTLILVVLAAAVSCRQGRGDRSAADEVRPQGIIRDTVEAVVSVPKANPIAKSSARPFPNVQVPSIYSDPHEKLEYMVEHYWDAYFRGGGRTDSAMVLGVRKGDLEQAFSNYVALLEAVEMPLAHKGMKNLFTQIEAAQARDTVKHVYLQLTEIVARYLYDPNSPMRNEDFYLPFVKAMAESPMTREDMLPAYRYEARMCAMNQFGQVAPDFQFRTLEGKIHTLHSVKAEYTMLFFSNPYCESCKSIIQDVMSRRYIADFLSSKKLAVVNVYIDEEVDKWREYAPNYPSSWYSGYDFLFKIRSDVDYNVRAIPSLYLLDREKRVIMKDAPTEKVLAYLDKLQ